MTRIDARTGRGSGDFTQQLIIPWASREVIRFKYEGKHGRALSKLTEAESFQAEARQVDTHSEEGKRERFGKAVVSRSTPLWVSVKQEVAETPVMKQIGYRQTHKKTECPKCKSEVWNIPVECEYRGDL